MRALSLSVVGLIGVMFWTSSEAADQLKQNVAPTNAVSTSSKLPASGDSTDVSPFEGRFSIELGDQGGGPVRYNTRFPSDNSDPNPTSYYHTQAFFGGEVEKSLKRGAIQFGILTRRDYAHRGIEGRSVVGPDGRSWTSDGVSFKSDAIIIGWVFGRMYREAPWRVSLAGVVDQTKVQTQVHDTDTGTTRLRAEASMTALSLRGRGVWRIAGTGAMDLHAGPELHVPVYCKKTTTVDSEAGSWTGDLIELQSSSAIGLTAEIGFRF